MPATLSTHGIVAGLPVSSTTISFRVRGSHRLDQLVLLGDKIERL